MNLHCLDLTRFLFRREGLYSFVKIKNIVVGLPKIRFIRLLLSRTSPETKYNYNLEM